MTSSGTVTINDKPKIVWKKEFLVYFEGTGLWQTKTKTRFNYDRCPGSNSVSSQPQERELTIGDKAEHSLM